MNQSYYKSRNDFQGGRSLRGSKVASAGLFLAAVGGAWRGFIFSGSGRGLAPASLLAGDAKSVTAPAVTDEVFTLTAKP